MMKQFFQAVALDLRYGARRLIRNPGFSATTILTLVAGIAASTTIFSVVNGVMIRALPYRSPGQLVMVWTDDRKHGVKEEGVSYPNYGEWRSLSRSFTDLAIISRNNPVTLTGGKDPLRVESAVVSANLFSVLGVQPALGRSFSDDEVQSGAHVIVLSHPLWQRLFAGSAAAIGADLEVDGERWRVIGVMPASFLFPTGDVQFFEQLTAFKRWRSLQRDRYSDWGRVVARLKSGVTVGQAQTDMEAVSRRMEATYSIPTGSDFAGYSVNIIPLALQVTGEDLPRALWMLFASVVLVLLIACTNVANMLLARGMARQREIVVRRALGATRGRVIRQLLTESLLLAGASGVVGTTVAVAAVRGVVSVAPANLPRLSEISVDARVLGFALVASCCAGLLFGIAPAFRMSRGNSTLTTRGAHANSTDERLRSALVIGEFALSAVLLCGAGLVTRSFLKVEAVDPGVRPERVLTVRVDAPTDEDGVAPFYAQVLERIRGIPGVNAAEAIEDVLQRRNPDFRVRVAGRSTQSTEALSGDAVTPGVFRAMGVRLIRGRELSDQDRGTAAVVVVNETMANHFWPGEDPIGRRFREVDERPNHPEYTVVGVVSDMHRQGLEKAPIAQMFWPYFQRSSGTMDLVIRSVRDPVGLTPAIRDAIRNVDKNTPVLGVSTLAERLDGGLAPRRFQSALLGVLSAIALILAGIGIYASMHYAVAHRTNEIGIRVALGATPGNIVAMFLRHAAWLTMTGLSLGLVASLLMVRLIRNQLFGVSPLDPVTFAGLPLLIGLVSLLGCLIPAWRASRVDPLRALRTD